MQKYLQYEDKYHFDNEITRSLANPGAKVISIGTCLLNADYSYEGGQCARIKYTTLYWAVVECSDAQ